MRGDLAPCALDAYPEAYEEFKHVLLALIFRENDETSPVASEWSERQRFDLAGLLSSILRAFLHAYDPLFSMTLRYLISIHKVYCFRQGVSSPISDLTERLLFDDRDPPATPQESLFEAPPFDEVDIQALAHAVELTRQGAVDSLKFAKGDLFQAFQNELCRRRLDVSMLDHLVYEYCVYRGIVDSPMKPSSAANLTNSSSRDYSATVECGNCRHSDGETSVNNVDAECAPGTNADSACMQTVDTEMRFASEVTSSHEDCSTSDANYPQTFSRRLRRSRCHSDGRRRKRWRERVDWSEFTHVAPLEGEANQREPMSLVMDGKLAGEQVTNNQPSLENVNILEDNKFDLMLEMKELADKGLAAEVVDEVNAMDPNFFSENPVLFFQLKQVEFLKLINDGNVAMALKVASTYLGPLAGSNQALLKPLKETLLAILDPNEAAAAKGLPFCSLSTSLQVAIGRKLGIEEPQLMKIMRATLHTHNEWFKLQMCKDHFEEFLKIHHLKEVEISVKNDAASKLHADDCAHGASQTTNCSSSKLEDGSSPSQVSSTENVCEEGAILKVMEFLALPRADAIHLLMQNNGNAETVIQQIFS